MGVLAIVAVLLLGVLGTRLWFLQGTQQAAYQAKVTASKTRVVYVPPERGRVFDAKGRILADNRQVMTIAIDWSVLRKAKDRATLFERLSGPLQTPVDELQRRYNPCFGAPAIPKCNKGQIYSPLLPLPLKEDVDQDTVNFLLERSEDYPGISVEQDWKRVYPYAPLASHVIGYMGAITATTIKDFRAKGYNADERVGQFGVELSMESQLHGSWGKKVYEIDAAGNIVGEDVDQEVAPVAGQDIQLSIDLDVQQYAEQALQTELRNTQNLPTEQMAHNPVDPTTNFKSRVFASSKEWGQVEWIPFKAPAGAGGRRGLQHGPDRGDGQLPDVRQPLAGIRDQLGEVQIAVPRERRPGQVDPGQPGDPGPVQHGFVDQAVHRRGGDRCRDHHADERLQRPGHLHARVDRPEVLPEQRRHRALPVQERDSNGTGRAGEVRPAVGADRRWPVSSDAFFYRIGEKFFEADTTPDKSYMKSFLQPFGFGTKTGIQLPFEYSGRVPDTTIKQTLIATGKFGKNEVPQLVVGDDVQVAIGQGLLAATPLQAVNAYSTLANGGQHLRPSIVKAIYAPLTPNSQTPEVADLSQGTVVQSFDTPTIANEVQLDKDAHDQIVAGSAARGLRPRGQLSVELLPRHHRRGSLRRLRRHADRRQDRHGAGRRRLPVERLVGVRRVQHRRDPAVRGVRLPGEVRATARRRRVRW